MSDRLRSIGDKVRFSAVHSSVVEHDGKLASVVEVFTAPYGWHYTIALWPSGERIGAFENELTLVEAAARLANVAAIDGQLAGVAV